MGPGTGSGMGQSHGHGHGAGDETRADMATGKSYECNFQTRKFDGAAIVPPTQTCLFTFTKVTTIPFGPKKGDKGHSRTKK